MWQAIVDVYDGIIGCARAAVKALTKPATPDLALATYDNGTTLIQMQIVVACAGLVVVLFLPAIERGRNEGGIERNEGLALNGARPSLEPIVAGGNQNPGWVKSEISLGEIRASLLHRFRGEVLVSFLV